MVKCYTWNWNFESNFLCEYKNSRLSEGMVGRILSEDKCNVIILTSLYSNIPNVVLKLDKYLHFTGHSNKKKMHYYFRAKSDVIDQLFVILLFLYLKYSHFHITVFSISYFIFHMKINKSCVPNNVF